MDSLDQAIRAEFPHRYPLELGTVGSSASGDVEPEPPNPSEFDPPPRTVPYEIKSADGRVVGRGIVEKDALGAVWVRTDFELEVRKERLAFYGVWHTQAGKAQLLSVNVWPERLKPRPTGAEP